MAATPAKEDEAAVHWYLQVRMEDCTPQAAGVAAEEGALQTVLVVEEEG